MTYVNEVHTIEIDFANKVSSAVAGLAERFMQARLARKTARELSALSTRELDDLGISRANIRAVSYNAAFHK